MIAWITRILLVVAALITGLFLEKNALNFEIVQMIIAMLLFTLVIMITAFWPTIKNWFNKIMKRNGK